MVKVLYNNTTIEFKGHAGYAPKGEDIVCAALSTAILVSINLLTKLNGPNDLVYKTVDGYIKLQIGILNDLNETIMENLIYTIKDIANQYPKYVSIKQQEVF